MEELSEGEGRRDRNSPVTSVLLAQPSLTSGRTDGGEGQRRETPQGHLPCRCSCPSASGAAALLPRAFRNLHNTPQKKKKATRFSPGLLQSQLQWREEEEEEPGTGASGQAGARRGGAGPRDW